jgi:hypothetical protein
VNTKKEGREWFESGLLYSRQGKPVLNSERAARSVVTVAYMVNIHPDLRWCRAKRFKHALSRSHPCVSGGLCVCVCVCERERGGECAAALR